MYNDVKVVDDDAKVVDAQVCFDIRKYIRMQLRILFEVLKYGDQWVRLDEWDFYIIYIYDFKGLLVYAFTLNLMDFRGIFSFDCACNSLYYIFKIRFELRKPRSTRLITIGAEN